MDQFEIRPLLNLSILDGSFNLTLTTAGLYLILVAVILYVMSELAIRVVNLKELLLKTIAYTKAKTKIKTKKSKPTPKTTTKGVKTSAKKKVPVKNYVAVTGEKLASTN